MIKFPADYTCTYSYSASVFIHNTIQNYDLYIKTPAEYLAEYSGYKYMCRVLGAGHKNLRMHLPLMIFNCFQPHQR